MHKVSLLMFASFLAVQLAALFIGVALLQQPTENPFGDPNDVGNSAILFAYVLFSAAALLLILKYYSGVRLFQFLEAVIIFTSMQMLFGFVLSFTAASVGALALTATRFIEPRVRPYLLAATTAVVGALLGSWLGLLPAAVLAALLAVYDVAAVFFTKHMIALAKGLTSRGASFSIAISSPSSKRGKTRVPPRTPFATGKAGKLTRTDPHAPIESLELGTGDLVIPAMLIVSALGVSIEHAAFAFVGAGAGFLVLLYVLERSRGFWPALPPIVGGTIGGILVWMVVRTL